MNMKSRRRRHYFKPHLPSVISVARLQRHFALVTEQIACGRVFYVVLDSEKQVALVPIRLHKAMEALRADPTDAASFNIVTDFVRRNGHLLKEPRINAAYEAALTANRPALGQSA